MKRALLDIAFLAALTVGAIFLGTHPGRSQSPHPI